MHSVDQRRQVAWNNTVPGWGQYLGKGPLAGAQAGACQASTCHPCQLLTALVRSAKRPRVAGAQSTCTENNMLPVLAFKALYTYADFQVY